VPYLDLEENNSVHTKQHIQRQAIWKGEWRWDDQC